MERLGLKSEMTKPHILVIDDELSMRELLEYMLKKEGYEISCAVNGYSAISMIEQTDFDLLLCDIRLGDITGLEVLRAAKKENPNTVVIMISAYASAETAVEAMNEGAYDYVPKPFDNNELKQTIAKSLKLKTVAQEKRILDDELKKHIHFERIIGNSPKMLHIYEMIRQVAKTTTNILITGESGTGKELIARAIHEQSTRKKGPFVSINCGSIPEALLESEFFGHKKGAFTGADNDKKGLFESAHNGTVFLDEIGEISPAIQVKLLKAVQDKAFMPVGGNERISVDIRFLSATNRKLDKEVIAKRFREDLFYRLNVIEIRLPPLRERKEDLRILSQHFLDKYSREMGKRMTKISSYAIDLLNKYDFPGNIRELENLIERSVALSNTNILLPDNLSISVHKKTWIAEEKDKGIDLDAVADGISLDAILDGIERTYINKSLDLTRGKKKHAAKLLGISTRSLRYRLKKLAIER